METNEAVQNIADRMAEIEKRAALNVHAARQMRDEFKAISDNGDVPPLLSSKYHARLVALTTSSAADFLELHHQMTESAKECGIDIPDAQPAGDDEIGILSGGGR